MESGIFVDFYGILDSEFEELLDRDSNSAVQALKEKALNNYNGYEAHGRKIMNTWSVMEFLERQVVKPYWVSIGVNQLRLEKICREPLVRNVIHKLVRGEAVKIRNVKFDVKSFKTFFDDFTSEESKIINCDPLLFYYLQMGYLSVHEEFKGGIAVKIPNEEFREEFKSG